MFPQVLQRCLLNSQGQEERFRNAAMAIKKWPGAGTNKRAINHEDEAVMGKGIEEGVLHGPGELGRRT